MRWSFPWAFSTDLEHLPEMFTLSRKAISTPNLHDVRCNVIQNNFTTCKIIKTHCADLSSRLHENQECKIAYKIYIPVSQKDDNKAPKNPVVKLASLTSCPPLWWVFLYLILY
jgi:hypothetical protein